MVTRTNREYECNYCGNKFEKEVGTGNGLGVEKVSDQVQCRCGNFLPTGLKESRRRFKERIKDELKIERDGKTTTGA